MNARHLTALAGAALLLFSAAAAQQTVGLFQYDPAATEGYTLFAPMASTTTYLIDDCGREVHQWPSGYTPAGTVRLLEDGTLMRTCRIANAVFVAGGLGGRIQFQDWSGNVTWSYQHSSPTYSQHHDATVLPNGNVLFITWENKTRAEAIAEGRDSAFLLQRFWPDAIIEVEPTPPSGGNVVWEWHAWDHLVQDHDPSKNNYGVVADHPELIDINYSRPSQPSGRDWLHTNAVAYNPALDQVALSIHNFDEVWVIDHSTTTQEAASHSGGNSGKGGDLLYRYGNPLTYGRGSAADHVLWGQHDVQWVPAGDQYAGQMMVFNNGLGRPMGTYSTISVWQPPVDGLGNYTLGSGQPYGPAAFTWEYEATPNTDFYSQLISGVQRLPDNHTLVCEGNSGRFFELDAAENMVWEYVNPVQATGPLNQGDPTTNNSVFRAYRYLPGYSGLAGQTLTPGDPLEGNPLPLPQACLGTGVAAPDPIAFSVHPNPFSQSTRVTLPQGAVGELDLYDVTGKLLRSVSVNGGHETLQGRDLPEGIYLLRLRATGETLRLVRQ